MKNIILSLDDGREDFYRVAFPIMKKFNLTGTINVVTESIENPKKYFYPNTTSYDFMKVEELREIEESGIEIACHGRSHKNTVQDILENIEDFQKMGISVENIGFASPGSDVTPKNVHSLDSLLKDGTISYIRSALIPEREGPFKTFLNRLQEKTHSSVLFYLLNKRNYIRKVEYPLFSSVVITKNTTVKQLKYLFKKMPDNTSVILLMHSVLKKDDETYGNDRWYWDAERFYELCKYISITENLTCIRNVDLIAGQRIS